MDAAFAGTEEEAAEGESHIDGIFSKEDEGEIDVDDEGDVDDEEEMLEQMPFPGNPVSERERKVKWLALPRRARIAIRRLHRNFKHLPKTAMVQMLRASRAPKEYVDAAKAHRCTPCETTKPKPPTSKVSAPKPYEIN